MIVAIAIGVGVAVSSKIILSGASASSPPIDNIQCVKEMEDNELVVDIVQKPIAIDSLMAKVAHGIGS